MEPNNLLTKIIIGFVVMVVCIFIANFFYNLDEDEGNDFGTFMHSLCVTLYTGAGIAFLGSMIYVLVSIFNWAG